MPAAVQAKFLYRLQPLPPGASAELVESFTKDCGDDELATNLRHADDLMLYAEPGRQPNAGMIK